ncbi:Tctex1 family [Leishmania braziliensis]|nr:Tctex1 family [Leishmania braziliensis]CAJ2465474.1 unnamed protein product [Leishmania braziliensis]
MADNSSTNSTAAGTVNSDLNLTRIGAETATLRGSFSAGEVSKRATISEQDALDHHQGSTAAGMANDEEGEATTSPPKVRVAHNSDGSGNRDEEGEAEEDEEDAEHLERVAASDVKNIILQALSPYFDDDAGGSAAVAPGVDLAPPPSVSGPSAVNPRATTPAIEDDHDEEDTAQRYDHFKAEEWIALVCDSIMERLVALGKPFKFVVHAMVTRKCGAGVHVCSSCYYAPMDGWLSHAHDLSAHLYAVVTVYWCAV